MKRIGLAFLILFALLVSFGLTKGITPEGNHYKPTANPYIANAQQRVHRAGNVYFCVTNWGLLGSQTRELYESMGGCFNPNPEKEVEAPSFETPPNSGLEYLFQGALWIGAIVVRETEVETLVTVGADGWIWCYELLPPDKPEGSIIEKSTRPEAPCYSPDAVSEQDITSIFSDTAYIMMEDPWDKHYPLEIEIGQESYSWSEEGYEDFFILRYNIKNIGSDHLSEMYLGLYMDTDIMHISENPYNPEEGAQDDITGFLKNYVDSSGETTEVNIAWAADNDGQPYGGGFVGISPTGIIGIKLLDYSNSDPKISYNWWYSDAQGYPKDWGPWLKVNQEKWEQINPYGSGIYFPDNAMGTPSYDISKYFLMSNGEIDFDQIFTEVFPEIDTTWIPADPTASYEFVQGVDTRFLYSFGPFDLSPGDSIFAVIALIAGEGFHTDPANRAKNLPNWPYEYYKNLDFSDLVYNAQKAMEAYQGFVEVEVEEVIEPADFSLKQNYPNPFNSTTTIPFTVHGKRKTVNGSIHTTLNIYNILGQKVRTLVDEKKIPGCYEIVWDGKNDKGNEVGSGVYLYQLKAGDYKQTKKMILLK